MASDLGKAKRKTRTQKIKGIVDTLDFSAWDDLFPAMEMNLEETYKKIMTSALSQLQVVDTRLFGRVNELALNYAQKRGAELVGMKYVKGKLVKNPNAKWSITKTTRKKLNKLISESLKDGLSPSQLGKKIMDSTEFSASRAKSIAETELSRANGEAAMDAWEESDIELTKTWLLTNEPNPCPICIRNAQAGEIPLDSEFPSGHKMNPAHPRCRCDVAAIAPSV